MVNSRLEQLKFRNQQTLKFTYVHILYRKTIYWRVQLRQVSVHNILVLKQWLLILIRKKLSSNIVSEVMNCGFNGYNHQVSVFDFSLSQPVLFGLALLLGSTHAHRIDNDTLTPARSLNTSSICHQYQLCVVSTGRGSARHLLFQIE